MSESKSPVISLATSPPSRSGPRRLKILRVDRALFMALFQQDGTKQLVFEGMPADAKLDAISDHACFDSDQVALRIESDTFEEVEPCGRIPEFKVTVREVNTQETWRDRAPLI